MDGGVFCNYPINDCLERFPNKQETLGIRITSDAKLKSFHEETSMPEYILLCVYKLILHSQNNLKLDDIQELCIDVKFKSLDPMIWRNFIDDTIRKEMYDSGMTAYDQFADPLGGKIGEFSTLISAALTEQSSGYYYNGEGVGENLL